MVLRQQQIIITEIAMIVQIDEKNQIVEKSQVVVVVVVAVTVADTLMPRMIQTKIVRLPND